MASSFAEKTFVAGLRNAHALENQALALIDRQLGRLEDYPDLKARLQAHRRETEGQIARLDRVLESCGESASGLKDTALSLVGNLAAMGHALAEDEILKNSYANFAFENFEIASYRSLILVADRAGMISATPLLEQSLAEEEAMARWLESQLIPVTERYLQLGERAEAQR